VRKLTEWAHRTNTSGKKMEIQAPVDGAKFRLNSGMASKDSAAPHYEFSDKYDLGHARKYFKKHTAGFWPRLTNWREIAMAREALVLAGDPGVVLDLPCGTGRFWEMLAEKTDRTIYVADNSQAMIDTGLAARPGAVTSRIRKAFQCSAFDTGLPDDLVECVFSIRLMHHIEKSEDRILMLKEFARISSGTVIVSLWVDGNFRACQRRRLEDKRAQRPGDERPHNRSVIARSEIEHDFSAAGLDVIGHVDFMKHWDQRRTYVLRVRNVLVRQKFDQPPAFA
jgi:SAM-dependent methyltransferase